MDGTELIRGTDSGGPISLILAAISVVWCSYAASNMFVAVLSMSHQKALVAYPVGLLYRLVFSFTSGGDLVAYLPIHDSIFAMLAIFSEGIPES